MWRNSAISRRDAPELQKPLAQKTEGAGNAGARCTRSLAKSRLSTVAVMSQIIWVVDWTART
jgi:hypothetical protein